MTRAMVMMITVMMMTTMMTKMTMMMTMRRAIEGVDYNMQMDEEERQKALGTRRFFQ